MKHFITDYGYVAVFLLMVAESACIPVPSELVMTLGGALAAGAVDGSHPSIVLVVVAGTLGNVVGSYLAWGVGRYGGRAAVHRWGRYVWLGAGDVERAERWFDRHGFKAVFFGRMLPVIRTFVSLPAGFAGVTPARFGLYTLLGCLPWTLGLAWAGYALGGNWEEVEVDMHGPSYAIAALVLLLLVGALVMFVRHRRPSRVSRPAPEGD